jgi:hypothetical protein
MIAVRRLLRQPLVAVALLSSYLFGARTAAQTATATPSEPSPQLLLRACVEANQCGFYYDYLLERRTAKDSLAATYLLQLQVCLSVTALRVLHTCDRSADSLVPQLASIDARLAEARLFSFKRGRLNEDKEFALALISEDSTACIDHHADMPCALDALRSASGGVAASNDLREACRLYQDGSSCRVLACLTSGTPCYIDRYELFVFRQRLVVLATLFSGRDRCLAPFGCDPDMHPDSIAATVLRLMPPDIAALPTVERLVTWCAETPADACFGIAPLLRDSVNPKEGEALLRLHARLCFYGPFYCPQTRPAVAGIAELPTTVAWDSMFAERRNHVVKAICQVTQCSIGPPIDTTISRASPCAYRVCPDSASIVSEGVLLRLRPTNLDMQLPWLDWSQQTCQSGESIGCRYLLILALGYGGVRRDEVTARALATLLCKPFDSLSCDLARDLGRWSPDTLVSRDLPLTDLNRACEQAQPAACLRVRELLGPSVGAFPTRSDSLLITACRERLRRACERLDLENQSGQHSGDVIMARLLAIDPLCAAGLATSCKDVLEALRPQLRDAGTPEFLAVVAQLLPLCRLQARRVCGVLLTAASTWSLNLARRQGREAAWQDFHRTLCDLRLEHACLYLANTKSGVERRQALSALCLEISRRACDELIQLDFSEVLSATEVRDWLDALVASFTEMLRDSILPLKGKDGIGDVTREKVRMTKWSFAVDQPGLIHEPSFARVTLSISWGVEDLVWQPLLGDCDVDLGAAAQLVITVRSVPTASFRMTSFKGSTQTACPVIPVAKGLATLGEFFGFNLDADKLFDIKAPNIPTITHSLSGRAKERVDAAGTMLGQVTGVPGTSVRIDNLYFNDRGGLNALFDIQFPLGVSSPFQLSARSVDRWQ